MNKKYIIPLLFIAGNITFARAMELTKQDISNARYELTAEKSLYADDDTYYCIRCMVHNTPIGYIEYNASTTGTHIKNLEVEYAYRSFGIGSKLFITALNHLKKKQYPFVRWHTKAVTFYTRFGAHVIGSNEDDLDLMEFSFAKDGDPKTNLQHHYNKKNNTANETPTNAFLEPRAHLFQSDCK